MRIVIIGGTGFLGYFVSTELIRRGHHVVAVGLGSPAAGSMPERAECRVVDLDKADAEELHTLLHGTDVVIHAAGADGRFSSPAPALDAFRVKNVEPFRRLIPAMKQAGTKRLIILGSYYTALHRMFPYLSIMERSAYPISRAEQAECAFTLAENEIDVGILELPFIFGAAPARGTLWGFVIKSIIDAQSAIALPAGGTACVTAAQVGIAAASAAEHLHGHQFLPIGSDNLSHLEIYRHFVHALGVERRFVTQNAETGRQVAVLQKDQLTQAGLETGYDPVDLAFWQTQHLSIDPRPSMQLLGFGYDDIGKAIGDTVKATQQFGGQGPASLSTEKNS